MMKKLTVSQASTIGNSIHGAYQISQEINQKIYEEANKFRFGLETIIMISEVRQYLTILENDVIRERQNYRNDEHNIL